MEISREKIVELICEQLDTEPKDVTDNARIIDDLGADSLDITELIMALEDETDIQIEDEEAQDLTTLGKIVEFLEKK